MLSACLQWLIHSFLSPVCFLLLLLDVQKLLPSLGHDVEDEEAAKDEARAERPLLPVHGENQHSSYLE